MRAGRSARAIAEYVMPSVDRSTRNGRRRPAVHVNRSSASGVVSPRSTTMRPVGPGRHVVAGLPSTARAGDVMPVGMGEVGKVVRPRARSAAGVTGPPGTVSVVDLPAGTRTREDQEPDRTAIATP